MMRKRQNIRNDDIPLSIILPAYNCAHTLSERLPNLVAYLDTLGVRHEIIIVDDGSHDQGKTRIVADQFGCIYVSNPTNLGKGAAVRLGMNHARGKFRIYTDADIPYELNTIERFLWYLSFKEFHFVAGDRTLPESSYFAEVPLLRRYGSNIYSFIIGRFFVGGWFDTQCGIKGFRDHVANDLFSVSKINGFAFDVELYYIALKRNYDIKRLPVRLKFKGKSSVRLTKDGFLMVRDLFIIRWHQLLNHYYPKIQVTKTIDTYTRSEIMDRLDL